MTNQYNLHTHIQMNFYLFRFQDICVGWPGRVHDARVLANSSLYIKGNNGTLFPRVCLNIHVMQIFNLVPS